MQKFWNKLVAGSFNILKLEPICFIIRLKGFFPPQILLIFIHHGFGVERKVIYLLKKRNFCLLLLQKLIPVGLRIDVNCQVLFSGKVKSSDNK